MSKMKDLAMAIEEAYFRGTAPEVVAVELNVPVDTVLDYYDQLEADEAERDVSGCDYDDSMDGDAASALASVGWGTDEDYGYYGDDY